MTTEEISQARYATNESFINNCIEYSNTRESLIREYQRMCDDYRDTCKKHFNHKIILVVALTISLIFNIITYI